MRPNDFGLFDILGNAKEWCHESANAHSARGVDSEDLSTIHNDNPRILRGGSTIVGAEQVSSVYQDGWLPLTTWRSIGFRIVRTHKPVK